MLRYDTYQKAPYDCYLVASLIKNASSQKNALEYIDDVCGQGSLNTHFRKLFEKISKLTDSQINGIIENSLYPVTMMVSDEFRYYEMLDATKFRNRFYSGNLFNNQQLLKEIMMPKDKEASFLDISFENKPGETKRDVYNATFTDYVITIELDNNHYSITKYDFDRVYEGQNLDISSYSGNITNEITDGQWNVLSQNVLDAIKKEKFLYKDRNQNIASLANDYIRVISVINVFGIYFFKETKFDLIRSNTDKCQEALAALVNKGLLLEYRPKSLVKLLLAVPDDVAKMAVEYILDRRDSKELAELGLNLIKKGYEKGWKKETLITMKNLSTPEYINCLYKVDNSLNYSIDELLLVDKNLLSEADAVRVKAYMQQRNNLTDQMNKMVGEIMNSGIREKMKSLKTRDSVYNQLNDFIKHGSAHLRKDYSSMPLEQLSGEYESIKRIYEGPFQKIKDRVSKEENKI